RRLPTHLLTPFSLGLIQATTIAVPHKSSTPETTEISRSPKSVAIRPGTNPDRERCLVRLRPAASPNCARSPTA
ncbi:hypothetical protein, partial [Actinoplanes italicus]|uniref:hypothetical protein n=1 Tax=Actinoplanes italicus TaxID=113567 RepID=UPI001B806156